MPTLLAAGGDPNVVQQVAKGYKVGNKTSSSTPATASCPSSKARTPRAHGTKSSISTRPAISTRSATTIGRSALLSTKARSTPPIAIAGLAADRQSARRSLRVRHRAIPGCICAGMLTCCGYSCPFKVRSRNSRRPHLSLTADGSLARLSGRSRVYKPDRTV